MRLDDSENGEFDPNITLSLLALKADAMYVSLEAVWDLNRERKADILRVSK